MSQPEKVTPSYLGPAGQQAPPSLYSVLKEQVIAPEYRDDNLRYDLCGRCRFRQEQLELNAVPRVLGEPLRVLNEPAASVAGVMYGDVPVLT